MIRYKPVRFMGIPWILIYLTTVKLFHPAGVKSGGVNLYA